MEADKKYNWFKIADAIAQLNFCKEGLAKVDVNNTTICVVLHKDKLFAVTYKCPHAGGHFDEGYVDALGNIVCPIHRYKFSLENGRNTSGEGYFLKNYPIEIRSNGIFVGFKKNNLLNWLK